MPLGTHLAKTLAQSHLSKKRALSAQVAFTPSDMWKESHMGQETRESKVARLERHVGRRSCGSSDMWTCRKMAQWGPIAEDDGLAGRKCEKGASPSTDKVESLSHDADTTCAFVMMRPIANTRLLLSQRISGCNRAPLWHFLTPGRRNSAIGMHGNQRQSSQRTSDAQMPLRRGHVCQISKMRLGRTMHAKQSK